MIKLNERLMVMAREATGSNVVADIGCDHGYLPIYLKQNNCCNHVIMADISKESLSKAVSTWAMIFPNEKGDFRVGDGLEVIKKDEVDTVTIAGMGGILMTEILGWNPLITASVKKLILQPRSHVSELRKWLNIRGFKIKKEELVEEGKFICEIITVEVPDSLNTKVCPDLTIANMEVEYEFPSYLINVENKKLIKEYLDRHLAKNIYIKSAIEKGVSKENLEKHVEYIKADNRIKHIEHLIIKGNL